MPTDREIPHGCALVSASEVDGNALEKELALLSMLQTLEKVQEKLELSWVPYPPPPPAIAGSATADAAAAAASGDVPDAQAGRGRRPQQRPRGLPTRIPPGVTEPKKAGNWGQIAILLDCIANLHDDSQLPIPAPGPAPPPPSLPPRAGSVDGCGTGDGYATGDGGRSGGEQRAVDDDVHIWAGAFESAAPRARLDKVKARGGWQCGSDHEYDDDDAYNASDEGGDVEVEEN